MLEIKIKNSYKIFQKLKKKNPLKNQQTMWKTKNNFYNSDYISSDDNWAAIPINGEDHEITPQNKNVSVHGVSAQ